MALSSRIQGEAEDELEHGLELADPGLALELKRLETVEVPEEAASLPTGAASPRRRASFSTPRRLLPASSRFSTPLGSRSRISTHRSVTGSKKIRPLASPSLLYATGADENKRRRR